MIIKYSFWHVTAILFNINIFCTASSELILLLSFLRYRPVAMDVDSTLLVLGFIPILFEQYTLGSVFNQDTSIEGTQIFGIDIYLPTVDPTRFDGGVIRFHKKSFI